MSRVIVRNLPNQVTEKKLKELFSTKGVVTDVQLKYTHGGKFRNFGFVGFQTNEQAASAKEYFDKAYFNASQIQVEICTDLDDPKKSRPWSKHSAAPSSNEVEPQTSTKLEKESKSKKLKKRQAIKDAAVSKLIKDHENEELFHEFMDAHMPNKKEIWQGDKTKSRKRKSDEDSDSGEENENDESGKVADRNISDMDYLKTKKKKSDPKDTEPKPLNTRIVDNEMRYRIKISNVPCTAKKADIKEFLKPARPISVRIPVNIKGIAYCDFNALQGLQAALKKHRSYLWKNRLFVKEFKKKENVGREEKWKLQEEKVANTESIAESGRIFVRNLPYTVLQDELKALFEEYGPISEILLPVDPVSRKLKGFAFVTFLIPEHACVAFNALDGKVLQGRMLHLLPARPKVEDIDDDSTVTFSEKKARKLKEMAKSSVNWNTFFINENCLAEAMAATYNTTKSKVLSEEGSGAAVRLALGETQMVQQTKDFLIQNGVLIEAFENMSDTAKSNTVILVKNLPYDTKSSEILEKFAPFGELANVLLSPFGGTAIVEFIEPSEAQKAYKRLAYSRFKHIPLYLEWAPKNIFDGRKAMKEKEKEKESELANEAEKDENSKVVEPVDGATIYVKGINFVTRPDDLKKHFESCGNVSSVTIAEKHDPKNPGKKLSMGYGFVCFADVEGADKALKRLQFSELDGHKLELKRSHRTTNEQISRPKPKGKPSNKIMIRNVPFQATQNELQEIFRVFGEIKSLRLPKKMVGTGSHRGFCFVDYHLVADAKRAFKALSESTHLYGRRLVLEWAEVDDDVETLRKKTAQSFSLSGKKRKKVSIEEASNNNDDEDEEG